MLSKLMQKVSIKGRSICAIELTLSGEEHRYWTFVQLKLTSKRDVKIIKQEYFDEAFDAKQLQLLKLNRRIPIVLCVTGTGTFIENLSEQEIEGANLSLGLDDNDVYHKEYAAGSTRYGCVIRKNTLSQYIQSVAEQGYFVWDVAIGPLNVLSIVSLIQSSGSSLRLGRYQIKLSSFKVGPAENTLHNNETCIVGNERCNTQILPALAAAIAFYSGGDRSEYDLLHEQQKEFLAYQKVRLVGYSFLSLLFIALLVNFLLFSGYSNQLQKYQEALNQERQQSIQLDALKKELTDKQNLLATAGIQRKIPISFLADRFASCVPAHMKLEKLSINPLTDKVREQKPILFKEGAIVAEGTCRHPDDLSELIKKLREEPWVAKIEKKEYRELGLQGYFIIEISYEQR